MFNEITVEKYTDLINSALPKYINLTGDEEDKVAQAMLYSLGIGGKRVRPMLVLEFCRVCGGNVEDALPFACAIEIIHTYSLIHDDLPCMDDDDYRRGMLSCHKKFDYATALLAGDGLLTLAFSVAAGASLPEKSVVKAIKLLSDCAGYLGMIGGQTMDLQHEGMSVGIDKLQKTDALKTGKLICAACALGCIAAQADEIKLKAAETYAENIGLAFQIVDDLLDITSTAEELGKPIGSDAENNKSTYPALLGIDQSRKLVAELTENAVNAVSVFGEEGDFLADYARKLSVRTK